MERIACLPGTVETRHDPCYMDGELTNPCLTGQLFRMVSALYTTGMVAGLSRTLPS